MMRARSPLTIQIIASLVERGVGQVADSELDRGWQRLSRRLAQEPSERLILPLPQHLWAKLATMRGLH
jgi:hypothetical protein